MTKKVKRMAFGGALGKLAGTASNIVKSVAPAVAPKPQPGMSINPPSNRVSMNVPKSPQDQAAYTEDVQKRLAELKAPSSNANTRPATKAISPVFANAPVPTTLPKISGPLGSSGSMSAQPAPPGGGLNMDALNASKAQNPGDTFKKGGRIKAKAKSKSSYSSGGKVSSASKRGDGCAQRGKTKGRMI